MGVRIRRFLLVFLLIFLAIVAAFGLWVSDKYVVPIMMYHHIDYTDTFHPMTTSPVLFEWHMDFLRRYGYNVISLDELVTAVKAEKKLPRNTVVVTFDDGYQDNYTYALEILTDYNIPATLFVSSHLVGKKGYLTWDQLREIEAKGVFIGSHSREHDYLPDLSEEEQRAELVVSKQTIEQNLGRPVDYLAYPSGGFTRQIKALAQEAGYKGACSTNRGNDRFNRDVYELNRIRFSDRDNSYMIMLAKLSGYYNLFRKMRTAY